MPPAKARARRSTAQCSPDVSRRFPWAAARADRGALPGLPGLPFFFIFGRDADRRAARARSHPVKNGPYLSTRDCHRFRLT